MRKLLRLCPLALTLIVAPAIHADTIYNLRASLSNGDYVTGTVSVNASGVVTGENASVLRGTSLVATVNTVVSQGIVSTPGFPSSYIVGTTGPASAIFVLNTPALSLANYAGGQLCGGFASGSCDSSFFYQGPSLAVGPVIYTDQGILAPASDNVITFDLSTLLDNGEQVAGKVTVDTTLGYVLDLNASLYSGSTVLGTFTNPVAQNGYNSGPGSDLSYLTDARSLNGYLFNLNIASSSLVNYGGGKICADSNGTNCDYSDVFAGFLTTVATATAGNLTPPTAATVTPEPSSLLLLSTGLGAFLAKFGLKRRTRNRRRQTQRSFLPVVTNAK